MNELKYQLRTGFVKVDFERYSTLLHACETKLDVKTSDT